MSAFLTSLASIGAETGEAKDELRKESEARTNKLREFSNQDAYLDLAKKAESRQQEEFEQRKKSGDLIEFKDGRIWSVSQGKFIDQARPDPAQVFKQFFSTLDPRAQKILGPKAQIIAEEHPYDQTEMMKAMLAESNKAQAEIARQDAATLAETNRREDATTRHTEHEEDMRLQRRLIEATQRQMVDYRLNEKAKFMTPQERQQYESIKTLEPMVSRLRGFIEKNKLEEENGWVFGNHSALTQHLRSRGYQAGVKQEPITQELIKDSAAISIMGAAPWVRIGRGKYTLEQIQQHLPKQTDTPANMYDKVSWLQDEVLTNAKSSLDGLVPPGGDAAPADTGAPPSGAVIHDFSH